MTGRMRAWVAAAACARPGVDALPWTAEAVTMKERRDMAGVCAVLSTCCSEVPRDRPTAEFWAGQILTVPEDEEQLALRLGVIVRGA